MIKKIVIQTDDIVSMCDVRVRIHTQLDGCKAYVDSQIVLNVSHDRCDGTENEVHIYVKESVDPMTLASLFLG